MKRKTSTSELDMQQAPIRDKEHDVAKRAAALLEEGPYHSLKRVVCEFHEGVLTLRGRVPSFYMKQVAQEILMGFASVEVLLNHLEVD